MKTKQKSENKARRSAATARALRYMHSTPELMSLLYDLDLLPEQVTAGTHDWNRMLILAAWHEYLTNPAVAKAHLKSK